MPRFLRSWFVALACALLALPAVGFAAAPVITKKVIAYDGRPHIEITIVETGARDTSEVTLTGLPTFGTIVNLNAILLSGTGVPGATINTIIGRATGFAATSLDWVATADTTGARIAEPGHTFFYAPNGTLVFRSTCSSSVADHAITTELSILEGWVY